MDIRPIRSNEDHRAALREIDRLWGAHPGSDDGDKLDILVALVERYEEANFALPRSSPLDVLKFVMRENGYNQADLAALLGSRSRASEILAGKRAPDPRPDPRFTTQVAHSRRSAHWRAYGRVMIAVRSAFSGRV